MKQKLILSCVLALSAGLPSVRGQSIGPSVLNAAGGSGTIGGNTFEYSIGEVVVSTYTSSSIVVTQGVLQPNTGSTGITDNKIETGIEVFPNPSNALVYIRMDTKEAGTLTYRLMDIAGRTVMESTSEEKAGQITQQLDLKRLANASYMLHVRYKPHGTEEQMNTFKIQKLN